MPYKTRDCEAEDEPVYSDEYYEGREAGFSAGVDSALRELQEMLLSGWRVVNKNQFTIGDNNGKVPLFRAHSIHRQKESHISRRSEYIKKCGAELQRVTRCTKHG